MKPRRRRFASLDRDGRRNNRKAFGRTAKIDSVLNVNELDLFAGMAADLYSDLSRFYDDHVSLVEDLRSHRSNVERALKDAKEGLKQVSSQIKAFNAFEKIMMKDEQLSAPINELSEALNKKISEFEEEVRFQTKELEFASGELEDTEANPMGVALDFLLKDLDQNDTVEGLQSFSAALGELIGEVGEDFLVDMLGSSDGSRMLDFMERIGF